MDQHEAKDRIKIIRQGVEDFLDDHELDISRQNINRLTKFFFKKFEDSRSISATSVNNELSTIFEYNELYRESLNSKEGYDSEELLMSIVLAADHKKPNIVKKRLIVLMLVLFLSGLAVTYFQYRHNNAPITVAQAEILQDLVDKVVEARQTNNLNVTHQALWNDLKNLDAVKKYGYKKSYKDFNQAQFQEVKDYLEALSSKVEPLSEKASTDRLIFKSDEIEIVDGDTFKANGVRFRLWGVDAFEIGQSCFDKDKNTIDCGEKSKQALEDIINQVKKIECIVTAQDRYQRSVVKCTVDEQKLGVLITRSGWALDYRQYSDGAYYQEQKAAQESKIGAWAGCFVMPWDYRHKKNLDSCE